MGEIGTTPKAKSVHYALKGQKEEKKGGSL